MRCFRYRTAIVLGPWRRSRREAVFDAVRNGFASWQGPPWTDIAWRFPGEIEEHEKPGAVSCDEV